MFVKSFDNETDLSKGPFILHSNTVLFCRDRNLCTATHHNANAIEYE